MLALSSESFVFKISRTDEFEHGIPEQVRVLAIVETPRHLLQVGC